MYTYSYFSIPALFTGNVSEVTNLIMTFANSMPDIHEFKNHITYRY